jgi:phenylpropionate dioxygenase-like ring-hydroxylating dioxygenase large terminal subunit
MAALQSAIDYAALVQENRVHGSIYTSQKIFEEEVEKIFHRTWMYVAHESEVPKPGDYVLRQIGRQPLIVSRGEEGQVHLLLNRCRHRSNAVCQLEAGNASYFRCAYHGWTYSTKGDLTGVPHPEAYDASFRKEDYGLINVPRMASYRGFIFGCLSPTGVTLDEHLGAPVKKMIDLFCDASPEGEIEVRHGDLKVVYYGNWKFQGGDGYHAPFTHKRVMDIRRQRHGHGFAQPARMGQRYARHLGNGHVMLDFFETAQHTLPETPWAREYRRALEKSYGQERADFIIRTHADPHLIGFPNWHVVTAHVRIITPVSACETRERFQVAFLKGVPPEINTWRMRQVEEFWGACGAGNPDDVEIFERNMVGLAAQVDPWLLLGRGAHREREDLDGTVFGDMTDEVTQRGQLAHWKELMLRQ